MHLIEWRSFSFLFSSTTLLKRKISILLLIFLLLAGGGYFAVAAFKIEIKARLAQVLLQHAWHKTIKTGEDQRPWKSFDGVPILRLTIPSHEVDQIVLPVPRDRLSLSDRPFIGKASFPVQEEQQYSPATAIAMGLISINCKKGMRSGCRTVPESGILTPLRTLQS